MLNSEMKGHMFEDGQYTFSRILEAKDAAQVPNPISVVDLETEVGIYGNSTVFFVLMSLKPSSRQYPLPQIPRPDHVDSQVPVGSISGLTAHLQ